MSQPVVHYDGNYITCYPGSNQSDDGKLNLEFNMARFITRLSSKNFCVTKPSFELKKITGSAGNVQIEVGTGQASINGMDLIMSSTITIDAPETEGTYYLAFKLHRDSSRNVLGDDVYGVTKTFMGVYLTYFDEKPDPLTDMDMLYLGKVTFDGTDITELEEDEDKYGRIWAEDILCKLKDPKHPDISRIILQDWIYKVPDWYVSKEGDVEYGAIDFMGTRDTEGTYGIHIQATDDNHSEYIMKAPSLDEDEQNRIIKFLADINGLDMSIGKSRLISNIKNEYALELSSPNVLSATTDKDLKLIGKSKVVIGTGSNSQQPKLEIKDNKATYSDTLSDGLIDEVLFNGDTLDHTIGKSKLRYSSNQLSLLSDNTDYFNIAPKVNITSSARIVDTIYVGSGNYGTQSTYFKPLELNIQSDTNKKNTMTSVSHTIISTENGGGFVKVANPNSSKYAVMRNNGTFDLYNSETSPVLKMTDGSYDVTLKQTKGTKGNGTGTVSILAVTAGHSKFGGDITATGDIRANKVYNAVYNDLAEFMEKADRTEDIKAGDVVYFTSDGKVTKKVDMNALAGIVSSEDTYGLALGGDKLEDDEKVPVALAGRVYLNIEEDIDIKPGDLLAIDYEGKIIRVIEENRYTLGKATTRVIDGKVFVMVK